MDGETWLEATYHYWSLLWHSTTKVQCNRGCCRIRDMARNIHDSKSHGVCSACIVESLDVAVTEHNAAISSALKWLTSTEEYIESM